MRCVFFTGRRQPATDFCSARATVSCPGGASRAMVLPPPIVAPSPIVSGAIKDAIRADVHVVADHRRVLVGAVVIRDDGAGADS